MEIGKISNSDLEKYVFSYIKKCRKEVISGPDIGLDTAILDFENDLIVLSTDPITGASLDIGNLAVNISCNDVVCQCADPVGILLTVLLPPDAKIEDLQNIIKEASVECEKNNLEIIGGHTEVTDAVKRIVVSTTVIGKVNKKDLPERKNIISGDKIVISKSIGIEGSLIIYNKNKKQLDKIFNNNEIKELKNYNSYLSVIKESQIAKKHNVKFLHDITEGGILGAIWESSQAINKKIIIDFKNIPVTNITKKISEYYNINPYRLISSGSLVMIFSEKDFREYKEECNKLGIRISCIGTVEEGYGAFLIKDNNEKQILPPETDELYKV